MANNYTGSANSFAQLKSAIESACSDNGWAQDGEVLHKGAGYLELLATAGDLQLRGGTGVDGSDALTGEAQSFSRVAQIGDQVVAFPVAYEIHIHTSPDEVYLLINYNAEFWQFAAFGLSDVPGVAGTGFWYGASVPEIDPIGIYLTPDSGGYGGSAYTCAGLFCDTFSVYGESTVNARIHHGLDGRDWSGAGDAPPYDQDWAVANAPASPRIARQPSTVNAATALIDFKVWQQRPDQKMTLVADLAHARFCRMDNLDPGEVITLGTDQWKAYPWYRKNEAPADRDGGINIDHTGTLGWAIRYVD